MPARSLWTGSISFGLVTIPVRLVSAVKHREVQFHEVHAADGARLYEKRFCSKDNREVDWDEVVKGFAISAKKVVTLTPRELDAAEPKASRTISVESFVQLADVDPIYYLRTYYLAPEGQGGPAYSLLQRAMEQSGRAGLARIVMRQHQYICLVRPFRGAIVLSTLLYADEVVTPAAAGVRSGGSATPKQVKVARQIVSGMSERFAPAKYKDTHRAKVLALIKKKARGAKIETPKAVAAKPTRVAELLQQLEKSKEVASFAKSRKRRLTRSRK